VRAQPKVEILIPSTQSSSHVTLNFNLTVLQGCTVALSALDPCSGENIISKVTVIPPAVQVNTSIAFIPLYRPVDFSIDTSSGVYDVTTILTKPVMKLDLTALLAEKVANQRIASATTIFETVKASGATVGTAEYERMRSLYLQAVASFRAGDVEDGVFRMCQANRFQIIFENTISSFKATSNLTATFLLVLIGFFSAIVSRLVMRKNRQILVGVVTCLSVSFLLASLQSSMKLTLQTEEGCYWSLKTLSAALITFAASYLIFEISARVGGLKVYGGLTLLQLKRRRLRTALTLIAISIVASSMALFVSVSFSSALFKLPISSPVPGPSGIIITKTMSWEFVEPGSSSSLQAYEANWFSSRNWSENMGVFQVLEDSLVQVTLSGFGELTPSGLGYVGGWFLMVTTVTPFKVLGNTVGSGFLGVTPQFMTERYNVSEFMVRGDFLSNEDPYGVLLSEDIAQRFGLQPGDHIELRRADRLIIDKNLGILLPQLVANLTVCGTFSNAKVRSLKDIDGEPLVTGDILVMACGNTDLPYSFSKLNVVMSNEERVAALAEDLAYLGYNVVAVQGHTAWNYVVSGVLVTYGWEFSIIPIVLGFLVVAIHLYQSVCERERDLATLTTVGANPSNIRNLVVLESITLTILGTVMGYIFSFPLSDFLNFALSPPSGTMLLFNQNPQAVFVVLLTSVLMSMAGSLLQIRKAISISVASRFLKPKFEQLFREEGYSMVSVLPFGFDTNQLETPTLAIERFLKECERERSGVKPAVYVWGDIKKSMQPNEITYEISRLMVDYYQDLVEFKTIVNLSFSQGRILIKVTLTPPRWGRKERDRATKLMRILRTYFLNLSAPKAPLKPQKPVSRLFSVMARSPFILYICLTAFIVTSAFLGALVLIWSYSPLSVVLIAVFLLVVIPGIALLYERKRKK
jgi:hypothetical protein